MIPRSDAGDGHQHQKTREGLQGYRCPACDRAFYVDGNEEAYACPICRSDVIWQLVGPFALEGGHVSELLAVVREFMKQGYIQDATYETNIGVATAADHASAVLKKVEGR